jgi:hypothetical protein
MIPKGLFTQIGMVIVAVAIIIMYVKPTFFEIGSVQDTIGVYNKKREEVETVNSKLSSLLSSISNVPNEDNRRLYTYMPDEVDEIAVLRDLVFISNESKVVYKDSKFIGVAKDNGSQNLENVSNLPRVYTFTLSVTGTYESLKKLFSLLEKNDYSLEVQGLNVTKSEGDFLETEIELVTYAYQEPIIDNKIDF